MGAQGWVALAVGLLGTAGLAGILGALDRYRLPSRLRAKVVADLALAEKFDQDDPAREVLIRSARATAVDLSLLTLVRRGGRVTLVRQMAGLVLLSGVFGSLMKYAEVARETNGSFASAFFNDYDADFGVAGWFNFAYVLLGLFVYIGTYFWPAVHRGELTGPFSSGRLDRLGNAELPLRIDIDRDSIARRADVINRLSAEPHPRVVDDTHGIPESRTR